MSPLDRLTELFRDFPGIGPRQAKRFVYFLLSAAPAYRSELSRLVATIGADISQCASCFRFFPKSRSESTLCKICADTNRDGATLMVVERDVDVESVERSGAYKGKYFVLGGTVPLASEDPDTHVRLKPLVERVSTDTLSEIILGFSATTDGDHTRLTVEEWLRPKAEEKKIRVTVLGRGLSTGSELEYADPETIKAAILGKK
jgi:recombination protein RecR